MYLTLYDLLLPMLAWIHTGWVPAFPPREVTATSTLLPGVQDVGLAPKIEHRSGARLSEKIMAEASFLHSFGWPRHPDHVDVYVVWIAKILTLLTFCQY